MKKRKINEISDSDKAKVGSGEDEESKEEQKNVKKRKLNETLYTVPNNTPLISTDLKIPELSTRQVNSERLESLINEKVKKVMNDTLHLEQPNLSPMMGDERMKEYIPRHISKITYLDHQKIDKELPLQMLPPNLEGINLDLASPELRLIVYLSKSWSQYANFTDKEDTYSMPKLFTI